MSVLAGSDTRPADGGAARRRGRSDGGETATAEERLIREICPRDCCGLTTTILTKTVEILSTKPVLVNTSTPNLVLQIVRNLKTDLSDECTRNQSSRTGRAAGPSESCRTRETLTGQADATRDHTFTSVASCERTAVAM